MPYQRPVYEKVKAATAGGGAGGAVAIFIMWVLDTYFFFGANMPDYVHGAVEMIVSAIIVAAGAAIGAFIAGYKQRETKA